MLLSLPIAAGDKDQVFGHEIPEFREVFLKLFKLQVNIMSMDQLKTTSAQLSDKERAAISYYLGEEGHAKAREGLPEDKQAFLDEKYETHTEITPEHDFKKMFPHVLAVANNNLTAAQLKETLAGLAPEDIASQSFYLGEAGRRALFTEMTQDRVEIILDQTADWAILETGKRKYDKISDYTCILYKKEWLGDKYEGRDGLEEQGVEKMLLKFRDKPLGIYAKWLDGPWKGREALYSEKSLGVGKLRVKESGILGVLPVTLPVDSELAMRGSNHMLTEIGMKYLIDLIEFNYRRAKKAGHVKRKNHGIVDVDGHKCYKMESILPLDPSLDYYCYHMTHYIDYIRSLEIKVEVYIWDDSFYESYYYTQIKLNPGLTDRDFDPENPDYNL
jgi:hypothetical protein